VIASALDGRRTSVIVFKSICSAGEKITLIKSGQRRSKKISLLL
jgi:hypothetical protein